MEFVLFLFKTRWRVSWYHKRPVNICRGFFLLCTCLIWFRTLQDLITSLYKTWFTCIEKTKNDIKCVRETIPRKYWASKLLNFVREQFWNWLQSLNERFLIHHMNDWFHTGFKQTSCKGCLYRCLHFFKLLVKGVPGYCFKRGVY